jgi:hypothetical protein
MNRTADLGPFHQGPTFRTGAAILLVAVFLRIQNGYTTTFCSRIGYRSSSKMSQYWLAFDAVPVYVRIA